MIKKKWITAAAALAVMAVCLPGCGKEKSPLDPKNPVSLTVWHYYHGAQQVAFDALVDEFNETAGKEKGIYVQGYSHGSVSDLETAVRDSLAGKVGSEAMPDIFSSYADTAYEVEQSGVLVNLSEYLSEEELGKYVASYIEEGKIASDGGLRIFPVAKSTEVMMINKTDWDIFAQETGAELSDLETIEGVAAVAQKYYEWTDKKTPQIPYDGKAFYGRDSMANYFNIGMRQLGSELFEVENDTVTLNIAEEDIKRIWENYYVPMVKGYFGAYGNFRSDDVKTGDLLAYTGATTSAMYFPDSVESENGRYDIEYIVMPAPVFEGGENYAVQQGAGMVVIRSDERHEYASVEFLKWFTQAENNIVFGCTSGYLPVLEEANSTQVLDEVIAKEHMEVGDKLYDCLTCFLDEMDEGLLYTNKSFKNGSAARRVLEYNLSDKAKADRSAVEEAVLNGKSLEEACAPYISEQAFKEWYRSFCSELEKVIEE
ncbi:MAG: extracellular solute-binding protein [Alistipes sp.]|nr:extracellular solute-binding protein [Alistipes sp.]